MFFSTRMQTIAQLNLITEWIVVHMHDEQNFILIYMIVIIKLC